MIRHSSHRIVISPLCALESDLLELTRREITRIFQYRTEVLPLLESLSFALNPSRNQVHSTPVLEKLDETAPSDAVKVLAVSDVDLYIPILTHVYGEAQLGGRACMISTYRLKEGLNPLSGTETFHFRVMKEAIHELGHTFDLRHCRESKCIMHYCRSIEDVDRKSNELCRYCRTLLNDEMERLRGEG